jgi:steroid delta-isomerase-like uncharacterized protein
MTSPYTDSIRELFDAGFTRGDFSVAERLIAPDYLDHSPIPAPSPGATGFVQRMQALRAAFVDEVAFGVFVADDDLVAFSWEFTGIHRAPFAGVDATGRSVRLAGINIERVRDGLIVEHWSQFDLAGLVRQISAPA